MGVGWGLEARIGRGLRGKGLKFEDFCEWRLGRLGRALRGPAGLSGFMVRSRRERRVTRVIGEQGGLPF